MGGRPAGSVDRAIAKLAASQNRVVKWQQLREVGLAPNSIAHRVAVGWLYHAHHGVYLLEPPATASRITLFTAAVYACGDGALLSHASAAELWGLLPAGTGDVHVTVPGRNPGMRRNGIKTHRSVALKARDVRTKLGIRLTSPSRTVLDLAVPIEDDALELLVATAHKQRLASERELRAVLARYPTHPGAARLKAVLAMDGGPAFTRSRGERRMLKLLRAAKLPLPEVNAKFQGYEVDFLWREERFAVEVDGYDFHSDRAAFESDRARDATLVAAGYRVIRVTARQLRDEPLVVIGRIAQALGGYERLPRP